MNSFNKLYRESLEQSFGGLGMPEGSTDIDPYKKTWMITTLSFWIKKENKFVEVGDQTRAELKNINFDEFYNNYLSLEKVGDETTQSKIKKYFTEATPSPTTFDENIDTFLEWYRYDYRKDRQYLWTHRPPSFPKIFTTQHDKTYQDNISHLIQNNNFNIASDKNSFITKSIPRRVYEGAMLNSITFNKAYFLQDAKTKGGINAWEQPPNLLIVGSVYLIGIINLEKEGHLIKKSGLDRSLRVMQEFKGPVDVLMPMVRYYDIQWNRVELDLSTI